MTSKKLLFLSVIIITILFLFTYTYLFFEHHFPFYLQGSDNYQYMGLMKVFSENNKENFLFDLDFFPGLFKNDFHLGINFLLYDLFKNFAGIGYSSLFFIIGITNFLLFIYSFYFFLKSFEFKNKIIVTILIFFFIFSAGTITSFGKFNSFLDLLGVANYPATLGMSIIFLLLGINKRCISEQKNIGRGATIILINFILFYLLFWSHILSGFIYLCLFFLFVISYFFKEKKINYFYIGILSVYVITMLLLTLWPYFNWFNFFIMSEPIQNEILFRIPLTLRESLFLIGPFIIGIFYIFKQPKKELFLFLWVSLFSLILASYLTPFRISSYWRFLPFLKIPLVMATVLFIKSLNNKRIKIFLITTIVIFSFSSISSNITYLQSINNNFDKIKEIDSFLIPNSKVFGDPFILYGLQGLGSQQAFLVADGHAGNVENQNLNKLRGDVWINMCSNVSEDFYGRFDYLIGDRCKAGFVKNNNLKKIYETNNISIYKITPKNEPSN